MKKNYRCTVKYICLVLIAIFLMFLLLLYIIITLPFLFLDLIMCIINDHYHLTKYIWTMFRDEIIATENKIGLIQEFGLFIGIFAILVQIFIDWMSLKIDQELKELNENNTIQK